jgi:hypothetical protein
MHTFTLLHGIFDRMKASIIQEITQFTLDAKELYEA